MFVPGGSSQSFFSVAKKRTKPHRGGESIQDDSDTSKNAPVVDQVEKQ